MASIVLASFTLFVYPYNPTEPPTTDDSGTTAKGIKEVVNSNNLFAFELYPKLNKNKNLFYSPYSISSALAMTYEGAETQTADEIKSVFHFPEDNILRPNFAAIYNNINKNNLDYELRTGNALWLQKDFPFLNDYINRIENYYGGKATNLDFVDETEESRKTINSFIEEQTNNKIRDLIPKGFLDSITRMVLTNAIYFKGTWQWEFDESETMKQDFLIDSNQIIKAQMMHMKPKEIKFNYGETENLQILELPYKGDKISMLILLPRKNLKDVEEILTAEKLEELKSNMKKNQLDDIYLPKFKFDTKYFMKSTLIDMGMPTAFSSNADFSGMTGNKDLFIDFVIHQAFIELNEEGTEAAAATAVGMKLTAVMPQKIFNANHPFIFIIQEKATGNILFLGKVVNPTDSSESLINSDSY